MSSALYGVINKVSDQKYNGHRQDKLKETAGHTNSQENEYDEQQNTYNKFHEYSLPSKHSYLSNIIK
jgi:hypothetical protein